MTLRRPLTTSVNQDVQVAGLLSAYQPGQLTGGVQQGDARVSLLDDEIQVFGWPGPPRTRDAVLIAGETWRVLGAMRVLDGALVIGHHLWVRGGSA